MIKKTGLNSSSITSNVSLLPTVSKIFEKMIQSQIAGYMEDFLSHFLCGYRKGFSVEHTLLSMLEKWRKSLDKGGYGGGILMDLSKAFDTLNHDLLIAKLHAYGFDKDSLKLVKSYLTDRWQRTKINSSFSSWLSLTVGVSQGSVVGPFLFNLFINDLFYIVKTDVCNYADDNTPYTCDMNLETLMNKLECATKNALDWFHSTGNENMRCKIENAQVMETHIAKLLGIQIDSELTFKGKTLRKKRLKN